MKCFLDKDRECGDDCAAWDRTVQCNFVAASQQIQSVCRIAVEEREEERSRTRNRTRHPHSAPPPEVKV